MELRGILQFLRLFLFTETPCNVAKRSVRRNLLSVNSILSFFRSHRSRQVFLRLYLRVVFGSKNLGALQVLFGVDVLGFLLLAFLTALLLAGGISNILGVALWRAKNSAGCYQDSRNGETEKIRKWPDGHGGCRQGRVDISSHPTDLSRGDAAWQELYPKTPPLV